MKGRCFKKHNANFVGVFFGWNVRPPLFSVDTWVSFGYYGKPPQKKSYGSLHIVKPSIIDVIIIGYVLGSTSTCVGPYSYKAQGQGLYVPHSSFRMDDAIVGVGLHIHFGNGGGQLTSHFIRVERPVSEHLSIQGKRDLRGGGGDMLFLVSKQNLNVSSWRI